MPNGRPGTGQGSRERREVRCAIYTRKSTEEGLEQEFNSLDAQREAAEAYIASQRSEGWTLLPDRYDAGGFTGGNMERPALKRLLADIEAGGVDCVVVYKVDRLSRSLLDLARIMEVFEGHHVSFVSVTQQFNTSTSLGRLMLNVLLSFAQFEREILAERTRDKMSAARRKGKWTGGTPVLGYDLAPGGRRLIVNGDEAEQVPAIIGLYLEHRSLIPVVQKLERRGWRTKRHVSKRGTEHGGQPYSKGGLFRLLSNALYTGDVNYRGGIYEGEHEPIVDAEVWARVQQLLRHNGRTGGTEIRNKYGALLCGLLYCEPCGTAMVHTYTAQGGKRYRYYVCLTAQQRGWTVCPTKVVPAHEIDASIVEHIRRVGTDPTIVAETLRHAREQSQTRAAQLESERRTLGRELQRLGGELRGLAGVIGGERTEEPSATARLADVQDRVRTIEQRMTSIREELISLQRDAVDENDFAKALSVSDPVWDSLSTREQCRVMRLLVERVGYDGRTGKVTAAFRSLGIRALSGEADLFRDQEAR